MRHFQEVSPQVDELFFAKPEAFDKNAPKDLLSVSLGATLYIPAIRDDIIADVKKMYRKGATSVVVCLEDSVPDNQLPEAEEKLTRFLQAVELEGTANLPLLFVRARDPKHLDKIITANHGLLHNLTGFIFPKFDLAIDSAIDFTDILRNYNRMNNLHLYYMPVMESRSIIYREMRKATLTSMAMLLERTVDDVLAVRIGATDMSSAYGLRRSPDFTVYDVHVVSSAIADIVNVLGRADGGHVITGAVWEHFAPSDRTFKPQIRQSIFSSVPKMRSQFLIEGYDNFIREIQLDKLNGITGKTVIHPSHINFVNTLSIVTHEEYLDALTILNGEDGSGGAVASQYKNKMNEVKPHAAWAKRTYNRAKAFGVSKEGVSFVDFLERIEL